MDALLTPPPKTQADSRCDVRNFTYVPRPPSTLCLAPFAIDLARRLLLTHCDLLQVLLAVMSGAFGLAGFYFGSKPTSSTSETKVSIAPGSMPWQTESTKGDEAREQFKYQ